MVCEKEVSQGWGENRGCVLGVLMSSLSSIPVHGLDVHVGNLGPGVLCWWRLMDCTLLHWLDNFVSGHHLFQIDKLAKSSPKVFLSIVSDSERIAISFHLPMGSMKSKDNWVEVL